MATQYTKSTEPKESWDAYFAKRKVEKKAARAHFLATRGEREAALIATAQQQAAEQQARATAGLPRLPKGQG